MVKDTHKRKRRACDQCRKLKSKCEATGPNVDDNTCRNCLRSGQECEYLEPIRKRGPPKGYMGALEQRLRNAEALLGVLVCSNDPRATSIVADLATDTIASSIISGIREGQHGLRDRQAQQQQPSTSTDPSQDTFVVRQDESSLSKLDAAFTAPDLDWQKSLHVRLALGARERKESPASSKDEVKPTEVPSYAALISKMSTERHRDFAHLVPATYSEEDEGDSDVHMLDEVSAGSQERAVGNEAPPGITCNYRPWDSKHRDRPVCAVLLHALGLDSDCWNMIYHALNMSG